MNTALAIVMHNIFTRYKVNANSVPGNINYGRMRQVLSVESTIITDVLEVCNKIFYNWLNKVMYNPNVIDCLPPPHTHKQIKISNVARFFIKLSLTSLKLHHLFFFFQESSITI